MNIQLQCGHISYVQGIPLDSYVICDKGECKGREVKLYAIETREWKYKCYECRYARWTGQSKSSAEYVGNQHWRRTRHDGSVDYLSNPVLKNEVRQIWGRKVKIVVLKTGGVLKPEKRPIHEPIKIALDTDKPPF